MSNYEVRFSNRAKKDAIKLEQSELDGKAKELVKIIKRNPYQNPPPFEKLAGGDYARRINIQHRLVYYILKEERIIVVTSMWTHYEYRERKKQALLSIAGPETACNVSCNVTVTHGNATEEEREEEIDIEYSSSSTENDIGKIIDLLKDGQFKLPIEKYLNKWISEWLVDFDITTIEGFIEEAIIHNKTDSLAYIKTIIKTRNKPSSRNGSTVKKPCPENKDTEKPKSNKYEKFYL